MKKRQLIFSSGIANSFEWYNYALFGHLAPVLSMHFFPDDDPQIALLNGLLLFAIGYLVRPIGGIFFGVIGDKLGRKTALSSAIMCMAIPSGLISLLPTYASLGVGATVIMIIIRMLQGLSMGGVLTGSVSFLIEHSPKERRGLIGSIPMVSISIGILFGSLVISLLKACLNDAEFISFGWRIPFALGFLIIFAGLYIKNHMPETPLFDEMKNENMVLKSPLKHALKSNWKGILISIAINSTSSVLFYMQAIYMLNYLTTERNISETSVYYIINCSYIVIIFATLLSGMLSDIVGRARLYKYLVSVIILSTFLLIYLIENGDIYQIWAAEMILAFFAGMYIGAEPVLQAECFPTNVRNTALSISYNIGTSVFGGTTPYLLQLLLIKTGSLMSAAYYLGICGICSLVALKFYKDRS
jgi:MHS family proline/betaine transporter-like MFS transporter